MTDEARQARNAYMAEWRKKHPEKEEEYKSRYWERKAAGLVGTDKKKRTTRTTHK